MATLKVLVSPTDVAEPALAEPELVPDWAGLLEQEAAVLTHEFFDKLRVVLRTRPRWTRPAPPG